MSAESFIPELWAAELLVPFRATTVYASPLFVNRDYEGEITSAGDRVHINQLGEVTVSDYTGTAATPEALETEAQTLVIDQARQFAFLVDDIDARQAAGDLSGPAMNEAAVAMAQATDTAVSSLIVAGAGSTLAPVEIDIDDEDEVKRAYKVVRNLAVQLDRANVPAEGRVLAIDPMFKGALALDPRFVSVEQSGDASMLRNGVVGRILGFTVVVSNRAPVVEGKTMIIASHPSATTYADALVQVESLRSQDAFADIVRGLHVSGAKVIRPEAVAVAPVELTSAAIDDEDPGED